MVSDINHGKIALKPHPCWPLPNRMQWITILNELGVTVYTPTQVLNQSHVVIMFQSGAGVEVVENERHLTARVYLPLTYMVSPVSIETLCRSFCN